MTDEQKQIADAISALRAGRERADRHHTNLTEAYHTLDGAVRSALAILTRYEPREPLPATKARSG